MHISSTAASDKRYVGPYVTIEPGYVDVRAHAPNGELEARRAFVAAKSGSYTLILRDSGEHKDFVVIADNVERIAPGKFRGNYCNLSDYVVRLSLAKISGDHTKVVALQPSLQPMTCFNYGNMDLGLYTVSTQALWTTERVVSDAYVDIYEKIDADFFFFGTGGEGALITARTSVAVDAEGCLSLEQGGCCW
jgi:hypothetical protein